MTRRRLILALPFLTALPALAHETLAMAEAGPIGEEVLAFRARFATVVAARNAGALRDMFTQSFTHTHG